MTEILQTALEKIRHICDNAKDAEGGLRQIKQIVRMAFGKAGIEPTPEAEPETEEDRLKYLINIGGLQVERHNGKLIAWVNDTELPIDAVQVSIVDGERAKVSLEYECDAKGPDDQSGEAE